MGRVTSFLEFEVGQSWVSSRQRRKTPTNNSLLLLTHSPLDGVDGLVVGVGLGQLDPLGVVAAHEQAVGQGSKQVLDGWDITLQGDPKYIKNRCLSDA